MEVPFSGSMKNIVTPATQTSVSVTPEGIPIYPSAEELRRESDEWESLYPVTTYVVNIKRDQVAEFYKTYLVPEGWVISSDTSEDRYSFRSLRFILNNEKALEPRQLELLITMRGIPQSERSRVELLLEYQPDVRNLPLYENARETVASIPSEIETRPITEFTSYFRVITYKADASPDDIKAYYTDNLPKFGWRLSAQTITTPENVLVFEFYKTPARQQSLVKLTISIDSVDENVASVELRTEYTGPGTR
jgi:hypothetical protein